MLSLLLAACADDEAAVTPPEPGTTSGGWIDEQLVFSVAGEELRGVLTLPSGAGPHPAVLIVTGSETQTGDRQSGVSDTQFRDLAHRLASTGYAAFRYDARGIGPEADSTSASGIEHRRDEASAALDLLLAHPAILADDTGLSGASQEAWAVAMVAAERPDDVAFIITVSGSGVSVAEQQVWGIETQSRAAGLGPVDVERAVVFGRLLIDWQLTEPMFHDANAASIDGLGDGPWSELFSLIYESDVDPATSLAGAIDILSAVQDESWAAALHLRELYLPALRSTPPEELEEVRAVAARTLLVDPRDHLTRVQCPVFAIFGEDDIVQPSTRSAELYSRYLEQAGNDHVEIDVLPDVDHDISPTTPGYWDRLASWLDVRSR